MQKSSSKIKLINKNGHLCEINQDFFFQVDFVISYDCPKFVKTYIHRVGRTARAGQSGRAVTLIENNQMKAFKMMLKQVGKNHQLEEEQIQVTENDVVNYEKALEHAKELT